jgi:hypothetical protein
VLFEPEPLVVVAFQSEQLLEVWLAVDDAFQRRVGAGAQRALALGAAEAKLVEDYSAHNGEAGSEQNATTTAATKSARTWERVRSETDKKQRTRAESGATLHHSRRECTKQRNGKKRLSLVDFDRTHARTQRKEGRGFPPHLPRPSTDNFSMG